MKVHEINSYILPHNIERPDGITNDFLRAGIPKDKIVLAFHPPDVRPYTEFAVS